MIVKNIKILSQNVCKNSLIINTLLEIQTQFDIILIQESLWSEIHKIPSSSNSEGDSLMRTCHHPNWITFARLPSDRLDSPRILMYVNIHLLLLCFLLHKDIINYKDISLISFFNNNVCYYIVNIYSDSSHTALKYLMLWDALDMDNFYFLFLLFSDFIEILFVFSFLFFLVTMKKHVTLQSHDMSHDVTS